MQILNPYYIRRGSGEAVEAVATQAQLQQVTCRKDAATYQAYINQRVQCDTAAAFLGRPSNTALPEAAGHMSRSIDARAPTKASIAELKKVKTDPTLAKLTELRDTLSSEIVMSLRQRAAIHCDRERARMLRHFPSAGRMTSTAGLRAPGHVPQREPAIETKLLSARAGATAAKARHRHLRGNTAHRPVLLALKLGYELDRKCPDVRLYNDKGGY
ncbi:hypothetical protein ARSEF4850_002548 [Beauveria asiatica]